MYLIGFFILIFLLGSIPFGLLISRYWLKIDIRQQGSGNIGMTNVMRVGGKLPGLLTFVLDFGKGSAAVLLADKFTPALKIDAENQIAFLGLAGVTVVCGHVFSVFLHFKGGKGISTLFGVLAVLNLTTGICAAFIWVGTTHTFDFLLRQKYVPSCPAVCRTCSHILVNGTWWNWMGRLFFVDCTDLVSHHYYLESRRFFLIRGNIHPGKTRHTAIH